MKKPNPIALILLLTSFSLFSGCGDTTTPTVTPQDEIAKYLDEHPELKEMKEIVPMDFQ